MRRNLDLIRELLFQVESRVNGLNPTTIRIDTYTLDEIVYHCYLLGEAGLATVVEMMSKDSREFRPYVERLTWAGHDFIDSVRDEVVWEKVKRKLTKVSGSASFEVVKRLVNNLSLEAIYDKG